jgi:hypothetical protein
MPVLKPRNRLVYFRVSEDEFLQFSAMCRAAGARSLSALARTAMQRMLAEPKDESPLVEKLKTFDELTSTLIEKLRCINQLLEANGVREPVSRESNGHANEPALEHTNV